MRSIGADLKIHIFTPQDKSSSAQFSECFISSTVSSLSFSSIYNQLTCRNPFMSVQLSNLCWDCVWHVCQSHSGRPSHPLRISYCCSNTDAVIRPSFCPGFVFIGCRHTHGSDLHGRDWPFCHRGTPLPRIHLVVGGYSVEPCRSIPTLVILP